MRCPGDRRDVADLEARVGGRLQQNQPRAVQDLSSVAGGREKRSNFDAQPLEEAVRQDAGAVVAVGRSDEERAPGPGEPEWPSAGMTRTSPGARVEHSTAETAAIPEAKTRHGPPSRAASAA